MQAPKVVSKRPNSELKVKINKSSSPRKVSKLDRSPTKRSADHLKKLSGDDDEEDEVPTVGNKKFTRDIADKPVTKLPHIPDDEV